MKRKYILAELPGVAQWLWENLSAHKTWCFYAPMGAGKTTLIHALCDMLKVSTTVSSPTFAIINEYESEVAGTIFHMDWYRLKDEEEAVQAGVEYALSGDDYCWIEWPEKAEGILPDDICKLYIEIFDEQTREITIRTLSKDHNGL